MGRGLTSPPGKTYVPHQIIFLSHASGIMRHKLNENVTGENMCSTAEMNFSTQQSKHICPEIIIVNSSLPRESLPLGEPRYSHQIIFQLEKKSNFLKKEKCVYVGAKMCNILNGAKCRSIKVNGG